MSTPSDPASAPSAAGRAFTLGTRGVVTLLVGLPVLAALALVPACGIGGKPKLVLAPKSIQLGRIPQEKKVRLTLTVRNAGSGTLFIDPVRVS